MNTDRLQQLVGVIPLLAWYGWSLLMQAPVFFDMLAQLQASQLEGFLVLRAIAQAASILFTSFLVLLVLFRDKTLFQGRHTRSYVAAIIGTCAASSFLLLPSANISPLLYAIATLFVIVGFGLSIYALIYFGRSFAILPSARALVTDGPYRFVRHPLYLFEDIAIMGIMLQFVQPWALLISIAHFAAQLARMRYEEQALAQAFPEYAAYATRTARLIPRVY